MTHPDVICSAIIELDSKTHNDDAIKTIPDRRSIHSVIREACARQNVLSQMIVTPDKLKNMPKLDSGTKGKAQQAVQDITTRQMGGIYDRLTDFYKRIGLDDFGKELSTSLDVISLSFLFYYNGRSLLFSHPTPSRGGC